MVAKPYSACNAAGSWFWLQGLGFRVWVGEIVTLDYPCYGGVSHAMCSQRSYYVDFCTCYKYSRLPPGVRPPFGIPHRSQGVLWGLGPRGNFHGQMSWSLGSIMTALGLRL